MLTTAAGLRYVRTPEERFAGLADFPYEGRYVEVEGLRLGYVDEGPRDGPIILLLHGQPDWSYLYRKMIPPLVAKGYRTVALDLVGFGRSDKPIELRVHTYEQHVKWVKAFIHALGLRDITLFCQDWGGLIGLRIVGDEPELFARVVAANTTIPVFAPGENPFRLPASFEVDCGATSLVSAVGVAAVVGGPAMFNRWIRYALTSPTFMPSEVMRLQIRGLSDAEAAAYDAPFPSWTYKAAPRVFPSMVVAIEDNNAEAWASLGRFTRPFLTLAGERDGLLGRREVQDRLIQHVPGARGQKHERFDAGHFIQDDIGDVLADRVDAFIRATPDASGG